MNLTKTLFLMICGLAAACGNAEDYSLEDDFFIQTQEDDGLTHYWAGTTSETRMDEIRIVKAVIAASSKAMPTYRPASSSPVSSRLPGRPSGPAQTVYIRESFPCSQLNAYQRADWSSGTFSAHGSFDPNALDYDLSLTYDQCYYAGELDEAGQSCQLVYGIRGSVQCSADLADLARSGMTCRTHDPCYSMTFTIENKSWMVGQTLRFHEEIDPRTGINRVEGTVCINGKPMDVERVVSGELEREISPIARCGDPE